MTSDPNAPGADAIYLYDEEIDNDPLHYQSIYVRIKVLTEKGKELSVVDLPYMRRSARITDIKARTIHADGTVIPLEGKPEDLLSVKSGSAQVARQVFSLPKVEVGSILEYRYNIRYDDNHFSSPEWVIQKKYFVRKAHYSFIPFEAFVPGPRRTSTSAYLIDSKGRAINSLIWWMKLPENAKMNTDVGGHYTLDVENIPAIPDEEWMPPIQSVLYKVFFYYKTSMTAQEYWVSTSKDWAKDENKFAEPTSVLRDAVSKIVSASDSETEKAAKIYKAVQALENTSFTRTKNESEKKLLKIKAIKRAEDVWKQQGGNRDEIALLYLALLRAAGLEAYPVSVVNRNLGVFDPSYLDLSQLDDTLVNFHTGKDIFILDPGEKMCPFRCVSWKHSGASGFSETGKDPIIVTTPEIPFKENKTSRTGSLTVSAQGDVSGDLQYTMTGQVALNWRQYAVLNDTDELKKKFDEQLESVMPQGVEAHVSRFLGLDNPDVNLLAFIKVTGKLGTVTSKRILLPAYFFESNGHRPFVKQAKRLTLVDMHYAELFYDQVDYQLPAGYTVEALPQEARVSWPAHAVYATKFKAAPGSLTVARQLALAFSKAKPEEYQDLRGFYEKVAASDQQQLVLLAPAAAAKGN